ncbi:ABC transporter permease [Actinophytocola sediminis]
MTGRQVLVRLGQGVLVLWAAVTVAFLVLYVLPGDPVKIMLFGGGEDVAGVDAASVAAIRAEYGFDQPPWRHYLSTLGDVVTLDLGRSIQKGAPVFAMIGAGLVRTAALAGLALVLAVLAGFALAVGAVLTRNRVLASVLRAAPSAGVAVPSFWVGLLLIQVFAFQLGWLPAISGKSAEGIVLPAVTLAVPSSAFMAQLFADSLRTVLREPYVDIARARGTHPGVVLLRDAAKNASLPVLTMLGMIVGNLLAGSVVVETVFSRDGLGRITYEAVKAQDIPVVLGVVVVAATIFVVVSLLVDLLYPRLDPRIRFTRDRVS